MIYFPAQNKKVFTLVLITLKFRVLLVFSPFNVFFSCFLCQFEDRRMTNLETSIATIIAVFQKYSEREGDKHKLKKSELKDLLHDELPDLMAVKQTLLIVWLTSERRNEESFL